MTEPLSALEERLGHVFTDRSLLEEALTHASFRNEQPEVTRDNERLEFLGDSVLGAAVAHLLVEAYPDAPEGVLTRYKAVLVSEVGLLKTAHEIGLGAWLRLGRGEVQQGGRQRRSLLANTMEAVTAAVYLDAGYSAAFALVERLYAARIQEAGEAEARVDFKTKLQELVQARGGEPPSYTVQGEAGLPHERSFVIAVVVDDRIVGVGRGRSKKAAEQAAARAAYEELQAAPDGPAD